MKVLTIISYLLTGMAAWLPYFVMWWLGAPGWATSIGYHIAFAVCVLAVTMCAIIGSLK